MAKPGCEPCCAIDNQAQDPESTRRNVMHLLCQIKDILDGGVGPGSNVNVAQVGGVATSTGAGAVDAGTLRTTLGTGTNVGISQTTPGTTNAVSLAQIGATTTATGNGVVGAGVQRVSIASDNTAFSVNATPVSPTVVVASQVLVTKAFGFFTATFQAVGIITSGSAVSLSVWNDNDTAIYLSWDGGTTIHSIIPPKASVTYPFAQLDRIQTTDIWSRYVTAPTVGDVYFEVIK